MTISSLQRVALMCGTLLVSALTLAAQDASLVSFATRTSPSGAHVVRSSIIVACSTITTRLDAAPDRTITEWLPVMRFRVEGPFTQNGVVRVLIRNNRNEKLFNLDCGSIRAGAADAYTFSLPTLKPGQARTDTGTYSYTISVAPNAHLAGSDIATGTFLVRRQPTFHTQMDWALTLGELWLDEGADDESPVLTCAAWFKGLPDTAMVHAELLRDSVRVATCTMPIVVERVEQPGTDRYDQLQFAFDNVRAYVRSGVSVTKGDKRIMLQDTPGNYTIRFSRQGRLMGTTSFRVADRRVMDNQLARTNNVGGTHMILPITVQHCDRPWDPAAAKGGVWFGNALK